MNNTEYVEISYMIKSIYTKKRCSQNVEIVLFVLKYNEIVENMINGFKYVEIS